LQPSDGLIVGTQDNFWTLRAHPPPQARNHGRPCSEATAGDARPTNGPKPNFYGNMYLHDSPRVNAAPRPVIFLGDRLSAGLRTLRATPFLCLTDPDAQAHLLLVCAGIRTTPTLMLAAEPSLAERHVKAATPSWTNKNPNPGNARFIQRHPRIAPGFRHHLGSGNNNVDVFSTATGHCRQPH